MSGPVGKETHGLRAGLDLPAAVLDRAHKLLDCIQQARDGSHRRFCAGLETAKALNPASIDGLYLVFDNAATARHLE